MKNVIHQIVKLSVPQGYIFGSLPILLKLFHTATNTIWNINPPLCILIICLLVVCFKFV